MLKRKQDWDPRIVEKVRKYVELQRYRLTEHALSRLKERFLELRDVVYVLQYGYHEKEKTLFNTKLQCWNYAMRAKTPDQLEARVIVAFEKDMIIITAIRLTRRKK